MRGHYIIESTYWLCNAVYGYRYAGFLLCERIWRIFVRAFVAGRRIFIALQMLKSYMEIKREMEDTKPQELIELLKGHRVFLQTHNFPDPDAISSAFGLQKFLEYYGVETTVCYVGSIDRFNTRKMMDNFGIEIYSYDNIKDMTFDDYIVHVDCQKPNVNTTDLPGNEIACVDHHPIFEETKDYIYKDIRILGACATIIAYYYKSTNTPIDKNVASALAYGIKMDTDDLIRGVTQLDMDMMSYLFAHADWSKLSSMYNSTIEFHDLSAYGAAIENIEVFDSVGFTYMPFECPNSLVAIISDFIMSLDVVDISVVYSINAAGIKFSVRSEKKGVDAGKLVHDALDGIGTGGGHAAMAGGFIDEKSVKKLGNQYDRKIKELFMTALKKMYQVTK